MDNLSQGVVVTIVATFFLLLTGIGIIALVLLQQRRRMEGQLQAQEEILKKISQEIHDNIGQILMVVKLNLNTVDFENRNALENKVEDIKVLIGNAIQDLRNLSKLLSSDYISSHGLIESIESEIRQLKKHSTYNIQFDIVGEPYKLPAQSELRLFRVFQEVLTNILKHANADAIVINITFTSREFIMKIKDNGKGFDVQLVKDNFQGTAGIGIRNLLDRAEQIGAELTFNSIIGEGTEVKVRLAV